MENLLKPKIKKNELKIIHKVLIKFVERFEQLYPERSMLSGVHELLHLVQCTKNFYISVGIYILFLKTLFLHKK